MKGQGALIFRPLYTDWAHYDAQTVYIVRRYRHDPIILAWDLRNEGDFDYGARPGDEAEFEQETVIGWLANISQFRKLAIIVGPMRLIVPRMSGHKPHY